MNRSIFRADRAQPGIDINSPAKTEEAKGGSESNIVQKFGVTSFNCKNINTSKHAIEKLSKSSDFIFLQEHWLFDCQLPTLKGIHENLTGVGKAVDSDDPIAPIQMPRGYGGVGILWKKDIDHLVTVLPDGGCRIQCVAVRAERPLLLISIYMPCKGASDNYEAFSECLDQLNEIVTKYGNTHDVVLGGDFNEEVSQGSSRRSTLLSEFLSDHCLTTTKTEKTFLHPNGIDSTTIDYIFYPESIADIISPVRRMDLLENNSDHYPVSCTIRRCLDRAISKSNKSISISQKVNWKKVDHEMYRANLVQLLSDYDVTSASVSCIDNSVIKFNSILKTAATLAGPPTVRRMRKPKLVVWSPEIRHILSEKKLAFDEWKRGGRPNDPSHPLLIAKREKRQALRRVCRNQIAAKHTEERQEILNAKSENTQLFHKLIRKQRGNLASCVDELHVSGEVYRGGDVLSGWFDHFTFLGYRRSLI